jgi:SOS response regulatory protein OraA/RecX
MIVTGLPPDPRQTGYVIVQLDGGRYASLPVEVVGALGLVQGMEVGGDLLERLKVAADGEAAYVVATRLLAMHPRSVYELLARLRDRGHNSRAAAAAVGAFARHFVRVRAPRGHGPSRLLHDLLAKGVDRRLAERAIAEVLESEGLGSRDRARVLAAKRSAQLGQLPLQQKRRRLLAYLARRGFRGRDVQEMVAEVMRQDA